MTEHPKIYLVHAQRVSMDPVEASFRAHWPQARLAHLLDESLSTDAVLDGCLTDAMIERFRKLGRYCADANADAILFTCSAFGRAIDAVKRDHRFPVLKPNEALYDELLTRRGRIALLATFAPTLPAMTAELDESMQERGVRLQVDTHLVEGALDALRDKRPEEHNRLIAEGGRVVRRSRHDCVRAVFDGACAGARTNASARADPDHP
jgi:hypothetical protein